MAARGRANPLALAVLTLLSERPMHPYEMSGTLRERRKEDSIKLNYGSLYSVVESLRKRGLIASRETVREGRRPERTVYEITEPGIAEMHDWLSDLLANPAKEFAQFEAALSLMPVLGPAEVVQLLEARLRTQLLAKQQYDAIAASTPEGFPRLFTIEAEFRQNLLETEIRFITELLRELKSGEFDGLRVWARMHQLRESGASPEEIEATVATEFAEEMSWLSQPEQH
ncbi:PadR family transcriptional regulator [Amycolatopsis sp. 195334CR]|uniref:PadR family transcriptional regulator n=1 Tax=Amycolatopsis sp. 195334CR TaxID=2814588 RepID=UPI001A8FFC4E|nr:PadR family transcriptional regulator [Amycolatopsis sp. 195334CR]MBN6033810.1 PadR family transcriptional regulator [Amycolatopsis sp. 195334CR]